MNRVPAITTTSEKIRPRSELNVTSPNPSVDIVTTVQYIPVSQL